MKLLIPPLARIFHELSGLAQTALINTPLKRGVNEKQRREGRHRDEAFGPGTPVKAWPRILRRAAAATVFCALWLGLDTLAQTPPTFPLSLDQNAFLYRTFPVYRTNTPPLINWQSKRGVPISTNALDPGSDGRAPTLAQQIAYGTNYPTVAPSPGQFLGFVGFAAVPVQHATSLDTNKSFAQNIVGLNWPRLESSPGQVVVILRAGQVGAP